MYEKELFIYTKAFEFAKRMVKLQKYLVEEKKEFILSKQLLRSGTSIGASIKEAKYAESDKDYIHKLKISLKEASESEYWIDLLSVDYLGEKESNSLKADIEEIIKLLKSSIKKVNKRVSMNK